MVIWIVVLLLFASSCYIARENLRWALYLFVGLLPFLHKEFFGFGFKELFPARIVLLAIFTILLHKYARSRTLSEWWEEAKRDKFFIMLLALWVWRVTTILQVPNKLFSLQMLGFFTASIGIYILFKHTLQKFGWVFIYKLLLVYVLAVVGTTLFAPIQVAVYYLLDTKLFAVWPLESGAVRFGSFGWDINHYAAYIVSALPMLYLLTVSAKTTWKKLLWGSGFLIAVFGWVLSISRSGWLAGVVAFIVLAGILLIKRQFKLALPIILLGFVSLVSATGLAWTKGYFLEDRFLSLVGLQESDSTSAHMFLLKAGFEVFKSSPVLGVGYGGFNDAFREHPMSKEYFAKDPIGLARLPAHSIWLEVLSETGVVGLAIYVIVVGMILWGLLKSVLTAPARLSLPALGIFSAIVGLLVSGIFYSYNLEFFWVTLFFGYFVGQQSKKYWDKLSSFQRELGLAVDVLALPFVIVLASLFLFNKLGRNALIDWDESIYATIARNIIRSGNWVSLYWRELGAEWFEKPPLYIWLTSLLLRLDQYNDMFVRTWSALSGVAGVGLMYLFGKKLFNRRVGFISALVLASTVQWVWQGRNGTLDVMAAFFITLSLYAFWVAYSSKKALWWGLTGVGLGLVVMTKGVVVLVPAAVISAFVVLDSILDRDLFKYFRWKVLLVPVCALIVALPWHIAVWLEHGQDFIDSYFFYHVLERSRGIEGHGEPFWWYAVVIRHWFRHWYALLLLALPTAVVVTFRKLREHRASLFVLLWIVITFFIFSPSKSKIQWYILPIYPALALVNAWFLDSAGLRVLRLLKERVIGLKELTWFPAFFWGSCFTVLVFSVPITLGLWKNMWFPEDFNYDMSESAEAMRYFSNDDDILYTYKFAPGPSLWYSDRRIKDINREQLTELLKGGGRYFILLPMDSWVSAQTRVGDILPEDATQTLYSEKSALLVGHCDWPEDPETGETLFTCKEGTATKGYVGDKRKIYIE